MDYLKSKTVTIFFLNGTPEDIVTAKIHNWNGKSIKIPRDKVEECHRTELEGNGVYFLFCSDTEDGQDAVYIGEAEVLQTRLNQHIRDYRSGKEKYYWQYVVAFTGSELNKTFTHYLEYRLYDIAKKSSRYKVLTKNVYRNTTILEEDKASMEQFIDYIKTIMLALNYRVLEPIEQKENHDNIGLLHLKVKDLNATGYITSDNQFIVKSGSDVALNSMPSCPPKIAKLRERCINEKKIKDGILMEDLLFTCSSYAGAFITGTSVCGPLKWKDKENKTLKELQK